MRLKTCALPPDFRRVNFAGMVFAGQRRRQMAGSSSLVAVPEAGRRTGKNRRRGNGTDRLRPMRRRLSQYLLYGKSTEERWSNLAECHELYCAGHLIEAGVASSRPRGKRRLLEVVLPSGQSYRPHIGPDEASCRVIPVIRKLNWR